MQAWSLTFLQFLKRLSTDHTISLDVLRGYSRSAWSLNYFNYLFLSTLFLLFFFKSKNDTLDL